MSFILEYWFEISVGAAALLMLIYIIILSRRLRAYKKMTTLLKGGSVEEHILALDELFRNQEKDLEELRQDLRGLKTHTASFPHNWHLYRYNAFDKTGSDLSFSLALLSDQGDGLVLTGIFGREDTRVYAKPVSGGLSDYTLSEEEKEAIKVAMAKGR